MISVGVNYSACIAREGKAGACLGSMLAPQLDSALPVRKMRHAFFGPKSCDAEIEMVVRTYKICAKIVSYPAAVAAEIVANGKSTTIRTFSSSGMDALIIGSFVVRK